MTSTILEPVEELTTFSDAEINANVLSLGTELIHAVILLERENNNRITVFCVYSIELIFCLRWERKTKLQVPLQVQSTVRENTSVIILSIKYYICIWIFSMKRKYFENMIIACSNTYKKGIILLWWYSEGILKSTFASNDLFQTILKAHLLHQHTSMFKLEWSKHEQ